MVTVNEMRNFESKSVMNDLKIYITRPPEMVPVHQKFMPQYSIPNIASFVFMSNHRDALSLEQGDRRFFVYWSESAPCSKAYRDNLHAWLDGGGAIDAAAWLLQRDVTSFDAKGHAPDSADKAAMQKTAQPEGVRMMLDMIEEYAPPFAAEAVALTDAWASVKGKAQGTKVSRAHVETALKLSGGGPVPWNKPGARVVWVGSKSKRMWAVRDPKACEVMDNDALAAEHRKSLEDAPFKGDTSKSPHLQVVPSAPSA